MKDYFEFNLQYFATPVQPVGGTFGVAGTSNAFHYTAADLENEARFGKLLEPGLRKIFFETYGEIAEEYSKFLNVQSSSKAKETDWGMGAFGTWVERADQFAPIAYQTLSPGLERTYTHKSFTSGFMVTKEMADDEQYGQMSKMAKALARSGRVKVEKDAVTVLTGAFTTVIYDGKALCANDHPLLDSAKVGDNLTTGALSDATLKAAIKLMQETLDEAGNLIQMNPNTLIIAPSNLDNAKRILHSTEISGGQLNDTNEYLKDMNMKIVVLSYLSTAGGGNDGYWFVQDSMRHELNFFWRSKPEFAWDEDFDTLVAKYRAYMRYSYGSSDWRGIVGSAS